MEGNGEYVTEEECRARTSALEGNLSGMTQSIKKFDLALFGADGRGGMQKEITDMHATLRNVEKALNDRNNVAVATQEISVKRLTAYTVLVASLFATLASIVVALIYAAI